MKLKKLLSVSLSLLLTFSLAFSILPTTAMAEGEDNTNQVPFGSISNAIGGVVAHDDTLGTDAITARLAEDGSYTIELTLPEGKEVDGSECGYVEFDLFVDDPTKIDMGNANGATLTSDGTANNNIGLQWQTNCPGFMNSFKYILEGLKGGEWNHVVLPYDEYLDYVENLNIGNYKDNTWQERTMGNDQPELLYQPGFVFHTPNLKKLNYFRLFLRTTEETTVKLANVMLTSGPRDAEGDPEEKNSKMLFDCDDLTGWAGDPPESISLDSINKTQGLASITTDGPLFVIQNVLSTPVDISDYDYLALDIYVEDENLFKTSADTSIELTSSGTCDHEEGAFDIQGQNLTKGWNTVMFPLSKAKITDGSPDLSKINYFRIYTANPAGTGVAKIDNIRVLKDVKTGTKLENGSLVINNTEDAMDASYFSDGFTASPDYAAPDTGSTAGLGGKETIAIGSDNLAHFNVFEWNITSFNNPGANREPIDLRGYDNIEFDLYIGDLAPFRKGEHHHVITLASSANDPTEDDPATEIDEKKYMWGAHQEWTGAWLDANLTLDKGWNHIVLPLDALGVTDAAEFSSLDLSKVDYIRYYIECHDLETLPYEVEIRVDNLVATKNPTTSPDTGDTVPVAPIALTVLGLVATVATVKVSSKKAKKD